MILNEASLSRVWQHFKSDRTIVIFTAFRDENTYEENNRKNKQFAAILKNAGFGYFFVDGYFPENEGTSDEIQVKENSIFAIAEKNKGDDLVELCHKLANSSKQESIIVKDSGGNIYFLEYNGNKKNLAGDMKPGKLGKYYTQLRNKKQSNTFVFESERDGLGYFSQYLRSI